MVIWSDYLNSAGSAMGVTSQQAGILLSLIFTVSVLLVIVIASRGDQSVQFTTPLGALVMILFFTYIGWFPLWTGSVIALVIAIFLGKVISDGIG